MGVSSDSTLDPDALRVWTRALDVRSVALAMIAVASPFMPTLHDKGWLASLVLALVFLPYNVLLAVRLRRRHRLDALMPAADLLLAVGFVAIVPETWPAIIGIAVADVAFAVVMFGRRVAFLAAGIGAAALTVAGLDIDHGIDVGVFGFLSSAAIVITTVGSVSARERHLRRSYLALVNGVEGIVWEWEVGRSRLTFMSRQVETILGWSVEEASDWEFWNARTHPEDDPSVTDRIHDALSKDERSAEFRVQHAEGHWVWLRDAIAVERDASGSLRRIRGIAVDVTRQRDTALDLQQYADIVEQIQFSIMVWRLEDPDDVRSLTAVRSNPASVELFGRSVEETLGRRLVDLWPGAGSERFATAIAHTIRTGERTVVQQVPFPRPDGFEGYFSVRMFPLPDRCAGLVSEDVTDQRQAEEALRHLALHDTLTGLPNRALLQDRTATALAVARRTSQPVALLVLDLDQFKEINDTLGHPMGDRMLEQVGARLATVLRDCDTVARLGGDEFAVLLTVDAGRASAERVARRIREALAEPFDLVGISVQTGASIGIVLSPEHGTDAETLSQRADIAMYNAKRSGRGYAFYAPEDDRSSLRRLALVGELRRALEREELVLHYQPQIDVSTGAVLGVEALVRWQHPEHGLLPPSEFIELAEVSGTIQPLTKWVVRTAVAQAAELARAGHHLVMSANVSARNLYDPDLVKGIGEDLAASGLPPELLMLELTESELVDDPSQVMTVLSLVSGMGVRLAIDDFGTGWSSLSNLTRLPIHQIKIDRSFVSQMLLGGDDAVIVRSIVDLGHNLGLAVVAEGVEDELTMAALASLGCDQAQGYLLCRPVPAAELVTWLDNRKLSATPA
ncbi:MAG: diguanylate cyclase [Acidimicrobiales bacterium]|nr:diguanylate cyclase [Acidimicrobiales bacterium]